MPSLPVCASNIRSKLATKPVLETPPLIVAGFYFEQVPGGGLMAALPLLGP